MNISQRNIRLLFLATLGLAILLSVSARGASFIHDDGPLNSGDVLIGPCGVPGAMGPAGVNDDFTNRSLNTGLANIAPGGLTNAAGTIGFRNTVQNTGGGGDVFLISAPFSPAGFSIEISIDNGDHYIVLDGPAASVALPVGYRAAAIVLIRITAPAGLKVLNGFDTVIRATSTASATATNDTIDRLYTGFIRIDQAAIAVNSVTGAAEAKPGDELEFAITYSNVSSAAGVGSTLLTAYNLVINENGNSAPNKWGDTTEHIVGATDTRGGFIIGDQDGSKSLTDIVTTLEAGQSGVFKFKRRVK